MLHIAQHPLNDAPICTLYMLLQSVLKAIMAAAGGPGVYQPSEASREDPEAEVTMEVNPADVSSTADIVEEYLEAGVNRMSIGVQVGLGNG